MFRNKVYLILLVFIFLIGCQPKDKLKWSASLSGPKYYGSGGPFVEYFYKGESIGGASTGGANLGWEINSSVATGGEKFKPVPDSISVKWKCSVDRYEYQGGSKLPVKKISDLFRKGGLDRFGKAQNYTRITAGMAPGGNVTLWLQGGLASTEVYKFKVRRNEDYKENDESQKIEKEILASKEFINSETNIFHYLHGVPYHIWETGEKEYNYDIGFSSKESKYGYHITLNSKDGSLFFVDKFNSFIPWGKNQIEANKIIKKKYKSPVQLYIQWYTIEKNYKDRQWYDGTIILPQNLEDSLKTGFYNRLFISIESDNHKDFVEGKIMLIGSSKSKTIMKFRLGRYDYKLEKQLSPKYILPKDFVFPKWEGREPLTKPTDFDYWQEK